MNTLGEYVFSVRSYECGADGRATLASVCNYLQESASDHARALGFSRIDFAAQGANSSWVLTRLHIRLARLPRWEEKVTVVTFPRGGRKIVAERDFELSANGERIGSATSEWMIIDLATRRIVPVPPHVYELANDERPAVFPDHAFARLRWDCRETSAALVFRAARRDIDLNGHVNNAHYVEWLAESLPEKTAPSLDFEIVFKSETLVGEEVRSEAVEVGPGVWSARVSAPDGRDHAIARFAFGA